MLGIADRLIVALDVPDPSQARGIVRELDGLVSFYKIGYWLLFKPGTDALIEELIGAGHRVFADCKLYDIGETVKRGVQAFAERGVSILTVHAEPSVMCAAVEGRGEHLSTRIFGVTVLTSLDDAALAESGSAFGVDALVARRVRQAVECGLDGVIASPSDDPSHLRALGGNPRLLVATPGIRPRGIGTDDHARHATPAHAVARGADYLVVGRPIVRAPDRRAMAEAIVADMERGAKPTLA
jgi:orotidine-5'-phosphate decarboxylase